MFGHYKCSYVTLVQTENNCKFVCNICSDITHFVCKISLDMRHRIFVCNIGSDVLYFRMLHKFGQK